MYLDMVPVLHRQSVHLIDDENLYRGQVVGMSRVRLIRVRCSECRVIAHFSFSIDRLNPRGLANIISQP
jgi:hypothetical protein